MREANDLEVIAGENENQEASPDDFDRPNQELVAKCLFDALLLGELQRYPSTVLIAPENQQLMLECRS